MEQLSFLFTTSIEFDHPVSNHAFLLRCLPGNGTSQHVISAQLTVDNAVLHYATDALGNHIAWGLLPDPHTTFAFRCEGLVRVRPYRMCEPAHPMYFSETGLTACDEALAAFAAESVSRLQATGTLSDHERATALAMAVHETMRYEPGRTSVTTTAAQAFAAGAGVCQDYAHILLTLCRRAGIAARYVTGYMLGEGASHAWVEAFDAKTGFWIGLDPTNGCRINCGYIAVGRGRDANDCSVSRGVMNGVANQTVSISLKVERVS